MEDILPKSTGSTYSSTEFNTFYNNSKVQITDTGQTLGVATDQGSIAMAINAAGGDYYDDSGAANAYVLSKPGTSSLRSPIAYFEGMSIRFRAANGNTGASTINVTGLGIKSILTAAGGALSAGDISTIQDTVARFDLGLDAFVLAGTPPIATKISKGINFLGDQRIILSNNAVDPDNDIDFTGGRFTFDDGTGQEIVGPLIKQFDTVFAAGTNQGGLDVLPKANDSWYYVFAVFNPSNGVSDCAATLNIAGPALVGNLAGFTKKRRVGAIKTKPAGVGAGDIWQFIQIGKYFYLKTEIESWATTIGTTAVSIPLDTPDQIQTIALINTYTSIVADVSGARLVRFFNPDMTDDVPTFHNSQLVASRVAGVFTQTSSSTFEILTDSSAQIKARSNTAALSSNAVGTRGWIDINLED